MSLLRRYTALLFFFLLGALHSLSFAAQPLPTAVLPYVQLITLTLLIYQLNIRPTARARLAPAFFFALGNFLLGLYWLFISLHIYGELPALLSLIAVVLFNALLSVFYLLVALCHAWLLPQLKIQRSAQAFANALLWASLWTLFEWLRGTLFTGFPWLNIGYAHIDGALAGWAVITGAYGVTWVAVFTAAALACFFQMHRQPEHTKHTENTTATNTAPAAPKKNWQSSSILIGAFVLNIAGLIIHGIQWSTPTEEAFFIRLTQGNVPQSMKFDPERFEAGIQTYYQLTALPAKDPEAQPAVIVLPETVIPVFQDRLPAHFWQQWVDLARQKNATLLMGLPLYDGETGEYTNSVVSIDADTTALDIMQLNLAHRYDKHHLVPFGEFIPAGFGWFIDMMKMPLGDFQRGTLGQAPFEIAQQRIAPDICYEDVFGEEIIRSVRAQPDSPGATMLINISNLGWFGDTWALRQHLQISRMRALETARPMIRSTNTGITAVIDPDAVVRALLPQGTVGVLDVEVQGYTGMTPYVRWGNLPILALSLVLIVGLGLSRKRLNR